MLRLDDMLHDISARKKALGLTETPERIESLRNKGSLRTPAKRELLRRMKSRAKAAGKNPVRAYF
ncbi:hypothetical protein JK191_13590 [Gluconobacter sphaericus]|uniref:hypothetical protein n=1 Tax=Gluconobacter sphaericus TaxID=574987 RepID=UPI001B8B7EFD|nr:hypothetical protein [Gluconobacter sphaericus]MBS1098554.1 hypothetical protein [Gluconobacter sphaericus]